MNYMLSMLLTCMPKISCQSDLITIWFIDSSFMHYFKYQKKKKVKHFIDDITIHLWLYWNFASSRVDLLKYTSIQNWLSNVILLKVTPCIIWTQWLTILNLAYICWTNINYIHCHVSLYNKMHNKCQFSCQKKKKKKIKL